MKKRMKVASKKAAYWPREVLDIALFSFKALFNNPIILAPYLLALLAIFAGLNLAFLTLVVSGVISLNLVLLDFSLVSFIFAVISALLILLLSIFLSMILFAGGIGMTKDIAQGKKTNLKAMWAYGRAYWLRLLGVSLLAALIVLIPALIILGPFLAIVPENSPYFKVGVSAISVIITLLSLLFVLAPYKMVIENRKIVDSIKTGFEASKRNYLPLLLLTAILMLVSTAVDLIPQDFIANVLGLLVRVASFISVMKFALIKR